MTFYAKEIMIMCLISCFLMLFWHPWCFTRDC